MRTWWIVRACKELYVWGFWPKPLGSCNVGPYWTLEEATEMLRKWRG